jgi:hypothetical protein
MQLEPYLALFGRDRILTLTFEALVADPGEVVAQVCRWLGLPASVPAEAFQRRWNARPDRLVRARGNGLLNRLRFSPFWDRLAPFFPGHVRRLGARMAEEEVIPDPADAAPVLDELRPRIQERVEAVSALLGRSFPEWATLYAGA